MSDEEKAIAALKKVAKIWPKTLWLFADSGNLSVMKKDDQGRRAVTNDDGSGMDQDYMIDIINIEADGGDW